MSMNSCLRDYKKHNVTLIVRTCEPTYNEEKILKAGIKIVDLSFSDGAQPPKEIIDKWLNIVEEHFRAPEENGEH